MNYSSLSMVFLAVVILLAVTAYAASRSISEIYAQQSKSISDGSKPVELGAMTTFGAGGEHLAKIAKTGVSEICKYQRDVYIWSVALLVLGLGAFVLSK